MEPAMQVIRPVSRRHAGSPALDLAPVKTSMLVGARLRSCIPVKVLDLLDRTVSLSQNCLRLSPPSLLASTIRLSQALSLCLGRQVSITSSSNIIRRQHHHHHHTPHHSTSTPHHTPSSSSSTITTTTTSQGHDEPLTDLLCHPLLVPCFLTKGGSKVEATAGGVQGPQGPLNIL
ncbi:hypothetical protein BO94DRAFT_74481 [Aspergillus sclerotioniger CBS 115572]|uniref:Uncharacterized protein n=1 Tax=Aspergillus sclerotioniger CBS 115572 TaxID=1450535 RepID=A0A317WQW1_9EURO|nr:hypothetical protein BO94DRAFT_74481 [Aspergillus sclerotioniger CBS 115572]PWY87308.1 hypothetical protein BO94DRAFT_74481 [Aspergillus sclerotioniger CBS 115572]